MTVRDHAGDTANITLLGQYLTAGATASSTEALASTIFQTAADPATGALITTSVHVPTGIVGG